MVASQTLTTFAGWQGQGYNPHGLNADPKVAGPLGGGPLAYLLQAGSPAVDHGTTVTVGLRGMGARDYFGNPIPQGAAYDVGANEAG